MELAKLRFQDNSVSWTLLDDGESVDPVRDWIVHLEEINQSPNTIEAYARHISRFARFLKGNGKPLTAVDIADYDHFLQWLPRLLDPDSADTENLLFIDKPVKKLSASVRNQVHLAIKSFYRYLSGCETVFSEPSGSTRFDGVNSYKTFLDHINARRSVKSKDRYLRGNLVDVKKNILDKRIPPEAVLELIIASRLIRDAFLITLLYNTGMRIGEALGLRHTDIDLDDNTIWVIPRNDNENGARAKSGKIRAIPVLPYVIYMYEDYITSDEYKQAFESGTDYVFCNVMKGQIGRALSKSYADNLKNYLKKRTGHNFTWHKFRHTHASEAIADGHGLLQIADRLGHASPQTTLEFYKHLFSSEIRKLHLTGPEELSKRLEDFSQNNASITERDSKWI